MDTAVFENRYAQKLNPQQKEALRTVNGPVLLLAVPGSGKTTVLVLRLGYMVLTQQILPEQILTMTYTVAATAEMKQRFASLFGSDLASRMEFRTLNGVASRIISYYSRSVSGRPAFSLIESEGDLFRLLRPIYRSLYSDYPEDSVLRDILTAITRIKNEMIPEDQIDQYDFGIKKMSRIYQLYNQALRSQHQMDYDDQMGYALTILQNYPTVRAHFQQQYHYLCVDESQDTSRIQHAILKLLVGPQSNLFMVGDEDQSIYGFRAACPEALMHFSEDHPGARVLYMETNYRSTQTILSAAARFIARNKHRYPKKLIAAREDGPEIRKIEVSSREAQFIYLTEMAAQLQRDPSSVQTTAILCRNNDSLLPLIDAFERTGIRYRCRRTDERAFSSRMLTDLSDILAFSADPLRTDLFLRIYYKFGLPISKAAAEQACQDSTVSSVSPLQALSRSSELSPSLRSRVSELSSGFRALPQDSALEALNRIWSKMNYCEYARKNHLEADKLELLKMIARPLARSGDLIPRLQTLFSTLATHENVPDCRLELSTIHSSKGLEYDRVFLPDVYDGLFPMSFPEKGSGKKTAEADRLYEEERRLYYVAITRARNELGLFFFSRTSSFNRELLSSAQSPRHTGPDRPSGIPRSSHLPKPSYFEKKTVPPPKALPAAIDPTRLKIGASVLHQKYGRGRILGLEDDRIRILFESDPSERVFSLSLLIQKGLLREK